MAGNIPISLKLKSAAVHENSSDEEDAGIDLGLPLEKLNITGPRKKLLVLDLNGFLVHRVFCYDPKINDVRNNRRPDAIAGNFLVFNRPFCMEFLEFCFERFEVGLWSSARERNVDAILDTIKRGLKGKLLFVWDQAKCTDSGFKSLEKKDKPIFLKDLKKLLEVEDPSLPWRLGKFSSSNTLLIDDEPYKSLLNPPHTAIFPRSYKLDHGNDTFLGPEGELRFFLDGLADADDVPSYVKKHPIGQPAITKSHSDWNFYSQIIRRFR